MGLNFYHVPKMRFDCRTRGYPKGLKGDEICRNTRIVMIADVVDAITSGRPYKPTQEMNEAITILRSDEGKYSKEFVSVLEKILE